MVCELPKMEFMPSLLSLEGISQSDLHYPRLTLYLREVVKITGRSQPVQARICRYSTVGETSQVLSVCYVENVPAELQQMGFAIRHLPRFSQSQVHVDESGVTEVVARS